MTPQEYRRELDRVRAGPVALAVAIVREVRRINGRLSPTARRRVLDLLLDAIVNARRESVVVALRMHADQSPSGYSPDVREPVYDEAAVENLLARTLDQVNPLLAPVEPEEVSWPTVEREVAAATARHVDMAARDATVASVHSDREAVGFARVLQGETNCAFCLLMASRGPVYGSRYLAGDPDIRRFHDNCDCLVVAVFDENDWAGRDAWREAKAIYDEHGKGSRDPLNGVRRYLDGRQRAREREEREQRTAEAA